MDATTLFYLILAIFIAEHLLDEWISTLNARKFRDPIPEVLADVYDTESYEKSQNYKFEGHRFSTFSSWLSFALTLVVLSLDGFAFLDGFLRQYFENEIVISLLFFGILMLISNLIALPFEYYATFVIEEKYGFNKSTRTLFFTDFLKGQALTLFIGGGILALVVWFYLWVGTYFWIYTWLLVSGFSVAMAFLYTRLIVPLFNKQTPLEAGELRDAIEEYAKKVGFQLKNIYVIDGSKRSTKANAYFSGFGKTKQITLYDTLIKDLTTDEIVAVLAHEVGHYKHKHILFNILESTILTGVTLYVLSLAIENSIFSEALGVQTHSFHIGLLAFGLLYSPISTVTGLISNYISRKFEYQADEYAKTTMGTAEHLVTALKKLSRNSLSNLTPHSWNVFLNYSHPTLYQRVIHLQKEM